MGCFVKICGLTSRDDVVSVAEAGPDALGFVFWPGSPRCVDADAVRSWSRALPRGLLRVGVFVDAPAPEICEVRSRAGLDIVQLHGMESPGNLAAIGGRIWKAVSPTDDFDPRPWSEAGVEALVFDAAGGAMPGGTGRRCDWAAAAAAVARSTVPVLLAGGLTPDNVVDAMVRVRPWGVDVSSGVEARPGGKDPEKVRRFVTQCRGE